MKVRLALTFGMLLVAAACSTKVTGTGTDTSSSSSSSSSSGSSSSGSTTSSSGSSTSSSSGDLGKPCTDQFDCSGFSSCQCNDGSTPTAPLTCSDTVSLCLPRCIVACEGRGGVK